MDYGATHRKVVGACALGDTWATYVPMADSALRLELADGGVWQLAGEQTARFGLVNDYLGYLADRNYSPRTVRAYGCALRWRDDHSFARAAGLVAWYCRQHRQHFDEAKAFPTTPAAAA
jgi:hypothetical protein